MTIIYVHDFHTATIMQYGMIMWTAGMGTGKLLWEWGGPLSLIYHNSFFDDLGGGNKTW